MPTYAASFVIDLSTESVHTMRMAVAGYLGGMVSSPDSRHVLVVRDGAGGEEPGPEGAG